MSDLDGLAAHLRDEGFAHAGAADMQRILLARGLAAP